MSLNRVENANVQNKKVILSFDTDQIINSQNELLFDVPLISCVDTIELLLDRGASVILISQCGSTDRPLGFTHIAKRLGDLLKKNVELIGMPLDSDSDSKEKVKSLLPGEIVLLDNLYHDKAEATGKASLAKELATLADIYVNDALNSLCLQTSSLLHLPRLLPSYAGMQLHKGVELLSKLDAMEQRPLLLLLGGNKVSHQLALIKRFLEKASNILMGGAVAYTFLKSRAVPVGSSVAESQYEIQAFQMIEQVELSDAQFILPADHLAGDQFSKKSKTKNYGRAQIPDGCFGMDIGSKTLSSFEKTIKKAGTVLWYGPLGAIEFDFAQKSGRSLAKTLSKIKGHKIVIGFDTVASVVKAGYSNKMDLCVYNSKSALDLIYGEECPTLQALLKTIEE